MRKGMSRLNRNMPFLLLKLILLMYLQLVCCQCFGGYFELHNIVHSFRIVNLTVHIFLSINAIHSINLDKYKGVVLSKIGIM